eukprot:gene40251-53192_t
MIAIQQSERNGKVVAATLVRPNDEIMLITDRGVLVRTRVSEIRELGRATQGVTLIALDDGSQLSGLGQVLIKFPVTLPLLVALGFSLGAVQAQAQTKKELAAKIVLLQQPAIENLAISLAERPAQMMMNQAGMALQTRVAADKQEAVAKDIQAD